MNDKAQEQILDELSRHIVALAWTDAAKEPTGSGRVLHRYDVAAFAITGFVISVRDNWLLMTAGHILRQLTLRIQHGRRIVKSRLLDLAVRDNRFPSIPFDLDIAHLPFVDDDSTGLDYGIIPLSPLYRAQLEAGGVKPVPEEAIGDPAEEADRYVMLGLPSEAKTIELRSVHGGGMVSLGFGVPLLPVYRTREIPECLRSPIDRFYGKVPVAEADLVGSKIRLSDMDGMSGGPIFALKQTGTDEISYSLVAVQSSWAKEDRVIAACFVEPVVATMARAIDEAQRQQELSA